jgi:HK97 family phage prohead protease
MNKNSEQRAYHSTELRASTSADGTRIVSGIIPYGSLSDDLGGFREVISPGAFESALTPGADVCAFRDHDSSILLGRTKSKTLQLTDSPQGLRFICKLPATTQAADLAESIDRGDLDSNSFGFRVNKGGDKWTTDASGNVLRTLNSVELLEISPCSMPAYSASSVSIRTAPSEIRSKLATIEKRDDMDDEQNSMACQCQCPECLAGDCADCSDPDCDDPNCNDDDDEFNSVRCAMEMQLALRRREK